MFSIRKTLHVDGLGTFSSLCQKIGHLNGDGVQEFGRLLDLFFFDPIFTCRPQALAHQVRHPAAELLWSPSLYASSLSTWRSDHPHVILFQTLGIVVLPSPGTVSIFSAKCPAICFPFRCGSRRSASLRCPRWTLASEDNKCLPQEPIDSDDRLTPNSPSFANFLEQLRREGSLDDIGNPNKRQVIPPNPRFGSTNPSPSMPSSPATHRITRPRRISNESILANRNSPAGLQLPSHTPFNTSPPPSTTSPRDHSEQNLSPKMRLPSIPDDAEPELGPEQDRHLDVANSIASYPPLAPPTILTLPSMPPPREGNAKPRSHS